MVTYKAAFRTYGAYSVGSTVFIGNHRVRFPEKIKSLYYTSQGVLVRAGKRAVTDDAGASHYTLVRPDGTHRRIDVAMGDRVPGTNPDSPYLAYAAPDGRDRWDLVRVDLRTGREADRRTITGRFTWGGWEAPPVATAGDRVWALMDAGWTEWDASGRTVRRVPRPEGTATPLAVGGTRYVQSAGVAGADQTIRDFLDPRARVRLPRPSDDPSDPLPVDTVTADVSPDGRFARYGESYAEYDESGKLVRPHTGAVLLDLDTGQRTGLGPGDWGWTPDGGALQVDPRKDRVTVCDGATGRCRTVQETVPSGSVKLGGASYES